MTLDVVKCVSLFELKSSDWSKRDELVEQSKGVVESDNQKMFGHMTKGIKDFACK